MTKGAITWGPKAAKLNYVLARLRAGDNYLTSEQFNQKLISLVMKGRSIPDYEAFTERCHLVDVSLNDINDARGPTLWFALPIDAEAHPKEYFVFWVSMTRTPIIIGCDLMTELEMDNLFNNSSTSL